MFKLELYKNDDYHEICSNASSVSSIDESITQDNNITSNTKDINYMKSMIYPQFKNININSSNSYYKHAFDNHFEYNKKNANYLNITEIDCYKYPNIIIKNDFNKPIIYRGFCHSMKAIKEWNIDNLPHIFGNQKFRLEKYNSLKENCDHAADIFEYNNMKFFIDNIKNNIKNDYNEDSIYYYAGEITLSKFKNKNLYNYINNNRLKRCIYKSVLFAGGKYSGSQSHIHVRNDYILNQIIGTKIMYFMNIGDNINNGIQITSPYGDHPRFLSFNKIPPTNKPLKKFTLYDINETIFNIDDLDHSKYKIYKVVLNPGDSIIIPPWWFHSAITYDDFSLSVTHLIERQDLSYFYHIPELRPYNTAFNFLDVKTNKTLFKTLLPINNNPYIPYFVFSFSLLITLFYIASSSLFFKFIINYLFKNNTHFIIFFIITTIIYSVIIDH